MIISAKTKGINASELKYIAILAMLIDHIAWLFVPTAGPAGQAMHFVGRITAPVMCFFISEGYHYTKNLRRYFTRMCIFAVISHFAFAFCFNGGFFEKGTESVIATLTLSLLSVHVINSEKIIMALKLPLIMLIVYFAEGCDWGAAAIMFTLTFELARGAVRSSSLHIRHQHLFMFSRLLIFFLKDMRFFSKTPTNSAYFFRYRS